MGVFAGATKLLIVLTVVFLLLLDGPRLVAFGLRLEGPAREARYRSVAVDIYRAVSGYVTGNLVISLIAGTVTYVTLTILGSSLLGVLGALLAIPVAAAVEIVLREWWHRRGEGLQGEPPAGRVPQPAK